MKSVSPRMGAENTKALTNSHAIQSDEFENITKAEFASWLHPSPNWGVATVVKKLKGTEIYKPWQIPPEHLGQFLERIYHPYDWFMTPNEFREKRACDRLNSLRACWVDIDKDVRSITDVKRRIDGLPEPSLIVFSGRGYHVYWFLHSTQKFLLSKWNEIQRVLCHHADGDHYAKDAARFLRLPTTINSKSETRCRVLEGSLKYYDFDELEALLLPSQQQTADVLSLAIERTNRGIITPFARRGGKLGEAILWEGRLKDLHKLAQHRWYNNIATGHRDAWMFIAGTAISWLAPATEMRRELASLADRVCPVWTQSERDSRMHSILDRVQRAARGEKITWRGQEIDPRYRFKTDTIIDWLNVSDEEMRLLDLRHLVTKELLQERDRERKMRERRAKGAIPIEEHLRRRRVTSNDKAEQAKKLKEEGRSIEEISTVMEAGISTVYRWLKR